MAFEIGNSAHKLFPLSETSGTVSPVTAVSGPGGKITAEQLTKFDFLAEGETLILKEADVIEVVDYSHRIFRGGSEDFLRTRRIGITAETILTGPLAWRTDSAMKAPPAPGRHLPQFIFTALALTCLYPFAADIYQAWASAGADISTSETASASHPQLLTLAEIVKANVSWLTAAVVVAMVSLINVHRASMKKALKKDPAAHVLAPARRLWA